MSTYDPIALQAYTDLENAFSIAKKLWQGSDPKPTAEAFQATVATAVIHIKELRRQPISISAPPPTAQQAGQPRAAATARPAPAAPRAGGADVKGQVDGVEVRCLVCGGELWDNRADKKNPKHSDFRCKDKECKDAKGYINSFYVKDFKKQAANAGPAAWNAPQPVEEFPAALEADGGEVLPF